MRSSRLAGIFIGIIILAAGISRAAAAEPAKPNGALTVATFTFKGETQRVTLNDVMSERMRSPRFLATPTSATQRRAMVQAMIRQAASRSLAGLDGLARGMDRDTTLAAQLDQQMNGDLAQRLKDEIVAQTPEPAAPEIEAYYTTHKAEYSEPERFTMQYVFSYCDDMNDAAKREAARQRIEEAKTKIDAGLKFQEAAKKYSNSPSGNSGEPVGFAPGKINPVIEKTTRGLADGAVSGVVETGNGYVIVHRIAHQPAGQKSLDEVRSTIRARLTEQAQGVAWDKFYKEMLDRLKPTSNGQELKKDIIADDVPVFRYAGQVVRYGEVRPLLKTPAQADAATSKTAVRNRALETIFHEILLVHEARQRGLDKEKGYQEMRAQALRDLIAQADETRQIKQLSDEARVGDEQIERYYREHQDFFKTERQTKLKVLRVDVPTSPGARQADLGVMATAFKRIEAARRRLTAGEDFDALMKEFNGGWNGEWDFAPYGPRGHAIDQAVEKLKMGETSAPINYEQGFYLIKVVAAREPEQQPLSAVREKIAEILKGTQARLQLAAAHDQRLAECQFKIDEPAMEQVLQMLAPK